MSEIRAIVFRNTFYQMAAQACTMAIGLVMNAVLSRYLGVDGFGQMSYLFAFYYFFLALNDFGIGTIVIREISKHPEKSGEIVGSLTLFRLIFSLVSLLLAWFVLAVVPYPAALRKLLFIYSFILPIIACELPTVLFQAALKIKYSVFTGLFNRVLGFLLVLAGVRLGLNIYRIVALMLAAELATCVLIWFFSRRFAKITLLIDPGHWKSVLGSSFFLGTAGLLVALINRVDFIMLERIAGITQVGYYSAAYKIINLMESLPLMVMASVYPLMSRYVNQKDGRLESIYHKCLFAFSAAGVAFAVTLNLLAEPIAVLVFGDDFKRAAEALRILAWAGAFMYAAVTGGNLLISLGREKVSFVIQIGAVIVDVVLNLLLIPAYGFTGAAFSTTFTFGYICAATLTACHLTLKKRAV